MVYPSELLEKAQIAGKQQADVVDAVLEHRDALHADAEREAGPDLRVVADRLEHRGIDHPGAENLEPAARPADAARSCAELARPAADDARDVDLRARLGEREEARAKSKPAVRPEDPAQQRAEHVLQVAERDAAVDHEAFDLMEIRRVRDVVVR